MKANYLTHIDRVEQLSNDYSSLKDIHYQLKMKYRQQSEVIADLQATVTKLKLLKIPTEPKPIDMITLQWDEIKKDHRITAHFKATKAARKRAKKTEKDLKIISDKYYSLLAIMRQNKEHG